MEILNWMLAIAGGILLAAGVIAMVAGAIMFLLAAFGEDLWWGIAVLVFGPAALLFLILHWDEAYKGFLVYLGGTVVTGIGGVLLQFSGVLM